VKRKGILFTIIVALLLVVTGCSSQSKQNTASAPTVKKAAKVTTTAYDNLSKSDRDKVKFTFRYYLDDTSAGVVSVEINNQTKKKISFDQSKFIFKGSHDVKASKKGSVTVLPNKKMNIKGLFAKVDNSFFEESGLLVYKNDNYKLAYVEQNTKMFSSDNLTNKTLISNYKEFLTHRDAWDKQKADYNKGIYGNDSSDSSSDTTDSNSDNTNGNQIKHVINSEEEAMEAVEKKYGPAEDLPKAAHGAQYTYRPGLWYRSTDKYAYWIRITVPGSDNYSSPYDWMVYLNGKIVSGR